MINKVEWEGIDDKAGEYDNWDWMRKSRWWSWWVWWMIKQKVEK